MSPANIQYFIGWKMNAAQLIGIFKLGNIPVRYGVEFQYYVVQRDNVGPMFNFKVFFAQSSLIHSSDLQ